MDTELHRKAWEELGRSINHLALNEPFFGHLLGGAVREVTTAVETLAVGIRDGRIWLRVNPSYFLGLAFDRESPSRCNRVAVLKHEALHLLFRHVFFRGCLDAPLDKDQYALAADLVVNQLVAPWGMPANSATIEALYEPSLPPGRSLEWYYDAIPQYAEEIARQIEFPPELQRLISPMPIMREGIPPEELRRGDHSLWVERPGARSDRDVASLNQVIAQTYRRLGQRGRRGLSLALQQLVYEAIQGQDDAGDPAEEERADAMARRIVAAGLDDRSREELDDFLDRGVRCDRAAALCTCLYRRLTDPELVVPAGLQDRLLPFLLHEHVPVDLMFTLNRELTVSGSAPVKAALRDRRVAMRLLKQM